MAPVTFLPGRRKAKHPAPWPGTVRTATAAATLRATLQRLHGGACQAVARIGGATFFRGAYGAVVAQEYIPITTGDTSFTT